MNGRLSKIRSVHAFKVDSCFCGQFIYYLNLQEVSGYDKSQHSQTNVFQSCFHEFKNILNSKLVNYQQNLLHCAHDPFDIHLKGRRFFGTSVRKSSSVCRTHKSRICLITSVENIGKVTMKNQIIRLKCCIDICTLLSLVDVISYCTYALRNLYFLAKCCNL